MPNYYYGFEPETTAGTQVKPRSKGRGKRQEWVEEQLSYPVQRRGKPKVYSDGRYTYIYGLQWEA